nr:N-acetylmuramoyl-L-alanine amidase [uncultured Anaerobutyricum sp.]
MMKTIIKTNYFSRVFLYGLIFSLCIFPLSVKARQTSPKKDLCIVIDPGHGGIQSGTQRGTVEEKTLNLKIAQYLKEALEKYKGVTVSLTRDGDYDVSLTDRTQYSVDKNADLMVSIHNNATGDCAAYDNGCTVLAAKDGYKQELVDEEQKLACNILNELSALGIENQGILLRDSEANEKYENGELADYYAIIRGGVLKDIPTVLVEHAFVDDDSDFENYLSSDAKLKALAEADAKGIARYYQLTTEDGKKAESPLENYKEKIVHIIDGNCKHNKISYRTYYPSSKKETEEKSANTDTTTAEAKKQEQTTEKSAPEAKTDVDLESESQEKSSEESSITVENTSSTSAAKTEKRESVQTDSMILFVLIAALLIALILLGTLLKKRKK